MKGLPFHENKHVDQKVRSSDKSLLSAVSFVQVETKNRFEFIRNRDNRCEEQDLIQKFLRSKSRHIGYMCETKRKGQRITEEEGGHIMLNRGVTTETRVRVGVGCEARAKNTNSKTNSQKEY